MTKEKGSLEVRPTGIVGGAAIDHFYRVDSFTRLPEVFRKNIKRSIPASEIPSVFGGDWNFTKVLSIVNQKAMKVDRIGYSGRAPNIGYQMALLGKRIELITEVGDDFFQIDSSHELSYLDHLKKASIQNQPLSIDLPSDLLEHDEQARKYIIEKYGQGLTSKGLLHIRGLQTPNVIALSDFQGNEVFILDDTKSAGKIALSRPVPNKLLKCLDSIVVSSGNNNFNSRIVNAVYGKQLPVFFDVGLFEPSKQYLLEVVSKSTIVFGNKQEFNEVSKAFGSDSDSPEQIFDKTYHTGLPKYIIIEEKAEGKITICSRESNKKMTIGPIDFVKTGNSVGVCDAMTGGFVALFLRGYRIDICGKVGLLCGSAVWKSKNLVQEGMINWSQLRRLYKKYFRKSLLQGHQSLN